MRDDRLALISASRGNHFRTGGVTVHTTTIIVIHIWVLPFFFANVRLAAKLSVASILLAVVLAAGYYAYCVYGKTKRNKETEPLMPVATATPMT